jgi:hypothetical protein
MNSRAEQDYLAYKTCDEFPASHIQCFGLFGRRPIQSGLALEPIFKAGNAASSDHAGLFEPSLNLGGRWGWVQVGRRFRGMVHQRRRGRICVSVSSVRAVTSRFWLAPRSRSKLPARHYPSAGSGRTRLQPATYKALLRILAKSISTRRVFVPLPFTVWHFLALTEKVISEPIITKGQVELMAIDSVVTSKFPGFEVLQIAPRGTPSDRNIL